MIKSVLNFKVRQTKKKNDFYSSFFLSHLKRWRFGRFFFFIFQKLPGKCQREGRKKIIWNLNFIHLLTGSLKFIPSNWFGVFFFFSFYFISGAPQGTNNIVICKILPFCVKETDRSLRPTIVGTKEQETSKGHLKANFLDNKNYFVKLLKQIYSNFIKTGPKLFKNYVR